MVDITTSFDILTLIISTVFFVKNIKYIKNGAKYLVWLIVFVLYIVPLYIDYLYMLPDYKDFMYGFIDCRKDNLTNVIFDLFFIYLQWRILYSKSYQRDNVCTEFNLTPFLRSLLYLGIVLAPLAVILLIRKPFLLYTFGWRELGIIDPPRFYDFAEQLSYFSSSCCLLLLFDNAKGKWFQRLCALLFLYVSLSIQGKRAILFFVIICIFIIFYFDLINRIKNNFHWKGYLLRISVVAVLGAIYMIAASVDVHVSRGSSYSDPNQMVTTQRIDFFRDDRVRMAIYAEMHPDKMKILDYRCQTILPDVFGLFPISYLRDRIGIGRKTYQTYFTCALAHESSKDPYVVRDYNWMTVCCISEFISNFGLILSFIFIPILFIKFSRIVDKLKYPFNLLAMFSFVLVNLFDAVYVIVYIEILCIYYLFAKKRKINCI